jgi:hypothetical protein
MVVYEAARAICNLKNVTSKEVYPAVEGELCHSLDVGTLFWLTLDI